MDETTKPMENNELATDSPTEDNPVEIVDNPAEVTNDNLDADISEKDKELFTEFGEIIGEAIVDALTEVYGEEKAGEVCAEIARRRGTLSNPSRISSVKRWPSSPGLTWKRGSMPPPKTLNHLRNQNQAGTKH